MPSIPITTAEANVRLDRLLRKRLALTSLSEIYRLIRTGRVRVNGRKVKQDYRLQEGEALEVAVAEAELADSRADPSQAIRALSSTSYFRENFRVLFEDKCLLVCNKPEGLVVHPGTGHGGHDNLIDLARSYLLSLNETGEPDLVHRLDRDTSGVIVIAKDKNIVRILHEDLREGRFTKQYTAVCHGVPRPLAGTIDVGLKYTYGGYDGSKVKTTDEGLASRTHYEVVQSHDGLSRMALRLDTGRTHQIRVHLQHIGCPIVGDLRYGDAAKDAQLFARPKVRRRLYLHAWRISFPHPTTRHAVKVTAPEPEEFGAVMEDSQGNAGIVRKRAG